MIENNEEPDFHRIGTLLPGIESLPPASAASTRMPSSPYIGTTGSLNPAARASSSIGQQHGATGADGRPSNAIIRGGLPAPSQAQSTPSTPPSTPLAPEQQPTERLANERLVMEQISRLLGHYWTAADHPAARMAQAEDWLEDFGCFPAEYVRDACRVWRRTQSRRPTPADIRTLVIAEKDMADRHREHLAQMPDMSDEGIRARCARLYQTCPDRHAKVGFVCFVECDRGLTTAARCETK